LDRLAEGKAADDSTAEAFSAVTEYIFSLEERISDLEESLLLLERRLPPLESFERENTRIGNGG